MQVIIRAGDGILDVLGIGSDVDISLAVDVEGMGSVRGCVLRL